MGNLHIPDYPLPWEDDNFIYPGNLASPLRIEIEAQDLRQVRAFLPLGFDVIMLDNMSRPDMKKAIALIRAHSAKTEIEISGGVRFEDLAGLSKLGADRISVGSITNSAGALDIAFDIKAIGER